MLDYLVTSAVRRRLLKLLWGALERGSVAELAARAGVSQASAHDELRAMLHVQLVVSERQSSREVFSANLRHPQAASLKALASADSNQAALPSEDDGELRRKLKSLGAPLRCGEPLAVDPRLRFETLLKGVELARRDPVVARTLHLCFWKRRDELDAKSIGSVNNPETKHALGFFLELASVLGGDRRLLGLAESLRDRRIKAARDFFKPNFSRRSEIETTFELAHRWGFRMQMDLESFRSVFDKFARG